ncbi:neurotrypsin-like, partial [Amphibalanus amphitrite]|uniref:neurotrypsin-like n=1 Tax=Amphibalanus amphitrite TaxID=1232801 RepID=UPI001C9204CF
VVTNAGFGSGNGVFLMDDLNCRGDEERLNDCDFAGWGRSDCTEAEVAGVKCRVEGEPCTSKQWRCRSGKCIDLTYVCDKVDDCGDFSDEEDALCKLPLKARLVGGTNSSGRVELRYKGIWGTACDDDFDSEDAQVVCRMLGFEGSAVVHDNAKYGPGSGQIWIDQLNCRGNEKSVDECHHLPWGSNNCAHEEDVGVSCHASVEPDQTAVPSASPPLRAMLPEQCGRRVVPDTPIIPLDQNPKIVSGKVTEPGSHPWMVGVRIKAGAETAHWCGAVIVSEWHIISAAHCLLDYPQQVYVLRVGDYDNQVVDPEEQEFTIDRMYPHEEFNKGTYLNHDIIVIRVKPVQGAGIRFGRQVQPVCLAPPEMEYQPGRKCTIAGWGSTGRRAAYARRLRSVVLPLLPISTCTARHVYGDSKITDGMYCAGYLEGGIDTCQGDSGGPMVCDENGVGVLYGVTSWGQGCARPNKPGVYTKITSYLPWIARTIEHDLQTN